MIDKEDLMEILAEEECLLADGFNDAIVGVTYGANVVAVYDIDRVIEILVEEGMDYDDAVEHVDFNIVGSYVGEKTPMFMSFVS
jgi:predicted thioredoxin/glutaredoxin